METTPLKRMMGEQGRKNKWLAQQVGIDETSTSMIVNGKRVPTLVHAMKIARVMDVTVEELFGYLLVND